MKRLLLALLLIPAVALAWQPTRPITAYIGFGPGSGNEISFRGVVAEIERVNPKTSFIVQTMPGADGTVSVNYSSKLPADGYSLNVTSSMAVWVTNEAFSPENIQYRLEDLYPVLSIGSSPMVIVARNESRVNTALEFIKYIQRPTVPVNIGLGGTVPYLAYGLIMSKAHGDSKQVKEVIYKGPAQALVDVAGNHIEFAILPISVAAPMIKAGKVKAIAITGVKRPKGFEKIDIMNDIIPGVVVNAMWSITLPRNTPRDVADWYVAAFGQAIRSDAVKQYFDENYIVTATDLDPKTAKKQMDDLRSEYLPMALKLRKKQN
jgi:tripartite-type tricarboxylate transporter receptor subunit TctC